MCSSPSSRTTTTTRPTGIHCSDQASSRLVSTQHVNAQQQSDTTTTPINQKLHIRLVPHVNHDMPCHVFPVMERDLSNGTVLKLGRYNDARTAGHHLSFKSKVVSRHHAKMWCENGKLFLCDTGSSSGTFVNHIRLRCTQQQVQDGDLIQLGMDYEGGHEAHYRAVRIRISVRPAAEHHNNKQALTLSPTAQKQFQSAFGGQECCICLDGLHPTQALFVSPCFHVYHYDCLRPLLDQHFPAFACPLCRSYADLGARPISATSTSSATSASSSFSYSGEPLRAADRSSLYRHSRTSHPNHVVNSNNSRSPSTMSPLRPPTLFKRVSGSLRSIIA